MDTSQPIRHKYFPWPQHDDHPQILLPETGVLQVSGVNKGQSAQRWKKRKKEGWWPDGKMASGKTFCGLEVWGQAATVPSMDDTHCITHTFILSCYRCRSSLTHTRSTIIVQCRLVSPDEATCGLCVSFQWKLIKVSLCDGQPFLPVFKKLLRNGRDESQLPAEWRDHQSSLLGLNHSVKHAHLSLCSLAKSTLCGFMWKEVILFVLDFQIHKCCLFSHKNIKENRSFMLFCVGLPPLS